MHSTVLRPLKVCHVIVGLSVGGAEMMLLKLLQSMDRNRFDWSVVALMDGGPVAERVTELGIPVHFLGMNSVRHAPSMLLKLRRLARKLNPDTVQGWMYHGNIAATLMAQWSPGSPDLLWNIRHSLYDVSREKFLTQRLIWLGGRWSHRPRQVVHNSQVSITQHAAAGFGPDNACMIPNGFDTTAFGPDRAARSALRNKLGLTPDVPLIGTLGRRHPMKGQEDFLRAVAEVASRHPTAHFVMAGRGVTDADEDLVGMTTAAGLANRVHLIGPLDDPAGYLAGLDVFCLTSTSGEGFPNVLGEAMSCGVPCVTTDVGEAATIVGRWGEVVPVANSSAFAAALDRMLTMDGDIRRTQGLEGRRSIATRYDLPEIALRYAALYTAGASRCREEN